MTDSDSPKTDAAPDAEGADASARPAPGGDEAPIDAEFEEAPPRGGGGRGWIAGLTIVLLVLLVVGVAGWRLFLADDVIPEPEPAEAAAQSDAAEDAAEPGSDEIETTDAARAEPEPAEAGALDDLRARIAALEAAPEPEIPDIPEPEVEAAEIESLREEIATLRADLEAAQTAAAEGGDSAAGAAARAALTRRVDALEDGAPNMDRIQDRLDRMDDRLGELMDAVNALPSARAMAALEDRIAALETREATSPAEAAWRFAALREAASGGAPFEPERAALARLRPNDQALAAMQDAAEAGVPTVTELRAAFPADDIRAAAAEEAEAAEPGRWDWLRGLVGNVATVRRLDDAPDDVEAAVAAAEAALERGDLRSAIEAVQTLSGAPAEAADYWLGMAQGRARLDARLEAISEAMAEEAGP